MPRQSWKTIAEISRVEYEVKKSVFIASCAPVTSGEEATDFLRKIKKEFPDARHHVYAYRAGDETLEQRYSDDGEPSGTAGVPVLEVIKKSDIMNAVVVVTRYFGGILLGAGGLVRAYSAAAKAAIDAAGVVTYEKFDECRMICAYGDYNDVLYRLGQFTVKTGKTQFDENVTIEFAVLAEEREKLDDEIAARFDGRYAVEKTGERFDVR